MEKNLNSTSRSTVFKLFSAFLLFGPFVIFHFFSVNPLFDDIIRWVCVGIGLVLGYMGKLFHTPSVDSSSLLKIPFAVRILLFVASLSAPVIAGLFLPFDYLLAFIVATVSMGMLMAAVWSWLESAKFFGDVVMVGFLLFSFFSFAIVSGDFGARIQS